MNPNAAPPPKPLLRPATGQDVDSVSSCVMEAYAPWVQRIGRKPWPMLQDYAAVLREEAVTVAEVNGQVAGLLVLSNTSEGLLIENVAVAPAWQGLGIGRALLQYAESEARRLHQRTVYLYTNELMVENIALYARCGYIEYERRQEHGFRRVFMRKALPEQRDA
jgi:N-acetylglutamate synthase-like GNAT family acetyltransferase